MRAYGLCDLILVALAVFLAPVDSAAAWSPWAGRAACSSWPGAGAAGRPKEPTSSLRRSGPWVPGERELYRRLNNPS